MRNGVVGASAILAVLTFLAGNAAADPVEYVRVCDAYGAGWYYIPGTETCLKPETGETKTDTEFGTYYGQTDIANRLAESSGCADLQRRFDAAFQDQSDSSSIAAASPIRPRRRRAFTSSSTGAMPASRMPSA